jgi:hypothetical protein
VEAAAASLFAGLGQFAKKRIAKQLKGFWSADRQQAALASLATSEQAHEENPFIRLVRNLGVLL